MDSKTTEKIMAIVVSIAINELTAKIEVNIFSTALRERNSNLIFFKLKKPDTRIVIAQTTAVIIFDLITQDFQISAAFVTHSGGVPNIKPQQNYLSEPRQ